MKDPGSEVAPAEVAALWARTLGGLRDPSLQVGWVRHQLQSLGAARAADVLSVVLARARRREEPYAKLLLRVSLALSAGPAEEFKSSIAAAARARDQGAVAVFFGAFAATQAPLPEDEDTSTGPGDALPDKAPESTGGRPLTLGERKSIARKRDRQLLARVLRDPHPDVIAILLDNPALVEADVIRLCAQRPVPPQVLAQVFRHPRWIVRHRVRLTLALNPHTPESVALQILPHLSPSDLREVARSSQISERVRAASREPSERTLH